MLRQVWAASGGQCGKYLAESMAIQLDGLERHGELLDGTDRYSEQVRAELQGEFARTLNLTDVHTGWVFARSVRNNAHVHILGALKAGVEEIPFEVTGLDFEGGTELLNKAIIKWAADLEIFFSRSRPYKKNDQATIESKKNHLVRKYGFYHRYDISEERTMLNRLVRLVNDRLNYLIPHPMDISRA